MSQEKIVKTNFTKTGAGVPPLRRRGGEKGAGTYSPHSSSAQGMPVGRRTPRRADVGDATRVSVAVKWGRRPVVRK